MTGPLEAYRARVASGAIAFDEAQAMAAEALEILARRLAGYEPRPARSLLKGLARNRARTPQPKGLYIFGGVGRGKSMLMDLFFEAAPIALKRRVHFHAFMLEVHGLIASWRKLPEAERKRAPDHVKGAGDDPIPPTAGHIAREAVLLCFDELHVEDVTDAMILGRLFTELFERGVILVTTSNQAPRDLYKDGINRQLFEPFIGLIEDKLDVIELDSGIDYRLQRLKGAPVYHVATGEAGKTILDRIWNDVTDGAPGEAVAIEVQGRKFDIPRAARGIARMSFDHLCREPRGAADYLALARAFHLVMIEDVPVLAPAERNEAKRFVNLIDALYEAKVKLVCTAAAPPEKLYVAGDGAEAFQRTVSRLIEMQSTDYLAERRIGA